MPTVTLLGRVFPAFYELSVSHRQPLDWKWQEENITLRFDCRIEKSIVTVSCTLERYRPEYFDEICKRAFDLTRSVVNLAAFSSGVGNTMVFETVIDEVGKRKMFAVQDSSLARLCTSFALKPESGQTAVGEMWDVLLADLPLLLILDDLIEAITVNNRAPIACARAVEGLRNVIAKPGSSDSQSWKDMRSALQLDRTYLQLITDTSTAPRHGDKSFVPGSVVREVTRRSWIIMDRFLHYRKRGNTPLPANEFPVLYS